MNKNYTLFVLNVCVIPIIAQTPITIGNSNMPGSGDTLRYTNFVISSAGSYTQTGVNFNWNFSQLNSTTSGVRSFKNGLQTPYSILFGLNAYGEKIADTIGAGPLVMTDYYNFYKKQTSPAAFIAEGVGMTFTSLPIPNYYTDKDELYHFPMTYPKYDSTTFKFSTTTGGIIPLNYSKVGYRVTVVDGWGTVTTPYGTESCLRLITTQYATDSIKNSLVPIPLGFPNYQRSYQWMTLNSKIPYLEITGTLIGSNFTPTLGRYRGYAKGITGVTENINHDDIRLYPNPVKDKLFLLKNDNNNETCEIYTIDGKRLKSFEVNFSGAENQLDVSELSAGVYLIKRVVNKKEHFFKFVKE